MKSVLSNVGTAFVALAASACCWIPALLGAGAAGSLGIGAALAPYRPYFLVLTGVFLLFGFTMVYRKPSAGSCDATGSCSPEASVKRNINKGVMWAVAIFAIGMAAYPYVSEARLNNALAASGSKQESIASVPMHRLVFDVEGMDCAACAMPIMDKVEQVPGVQSAVVDFDAAKLIVQGETPAPSSDLILKAVEDAGFTAKPASDDES